MEPLMETAEAMLLTLQAAPDLNLRARTAQRFTFARDRCTKLGTSVVRALSRCYASFD
jgi:hypothetical protein